MAVGMTVGVIKGMSGMITSTRRARIVSYVKKLRLLRLALFPFCPLHIRWLCFLNFEPYCRCWQYCYLVMNLDA